MITHHCAVCFAVLETHAAWMAHCEDAHEARDLDKFGLGSCQRDKAGRIVCPAARRPKHYGEMPAPRPKPAPAPFKAKDGTVYTPVRLPLDAA